MFGLLELRLEACDLAHEGWGGCLESDEVAGFPHLTLCRGELPLGDPGRWVVEGMLDCSDRAAGVSEDPVDSLGALGDGDRFASASSWILSGRNPDQDPDCVSVTISVCSSRAGASTLRSAPRRRPRAERGCDRATGRGPRGCSTIATAVTVEAAED
jgi:hypothetical protein